MSNPSPLTGLVGTVGRDPVLKETSAGNLVKFSLAVSDGFGEDKTTEWYEIAAWNEGLIEQILTGDNGKPSIYKGAAVAVQGTLKRREGYSTDVNAVRVGLVTWFQRSKLGQPRPVPVAAPAAAPASDPELDF